MIDLHVVSGVSYLEELQIENVELEGKEQLWVYVSTTVRRSIKNCHDMFLHRFHDFFLQKSTNSGSHK